MVKVSNLTKRFGSKLVVDAVSFSVQSGEIACLIGPNGAGKTTIMRLLAGYLLATGGTATIEGLDVSENSLEARRRIGYLSESLGLCLDMRIDEYLMFRAALKGVRRSQRRSRVEEVKSICGLAAEGRRIIGRLSRGYKQMTGLADAMVHDPKLLLLDEPTMGLDPNEARRIRTLISSLGSRYTVLLSTHLLAEAEQLCRKILVLNRGKIIADAAPEQLLQEVEKPFSVSAEIYGRGAEVQAELERLKGVSNASCVLCGGQPAARDSEPAWRRYTIESVAGADVRSNIFEAASRNEWRLRSLSIERRNLDDTFLELTTKS